MLVFRGTELSSVVVFVLDAYAVTQNLDFGLISLLRFYGFHRHVDRFF